MIPIIIGAMSETISSSSRLLTRDRVIKVRLNDDGGVTSVLTNIKGLGGVLAVVTTPEGTVAGVVRVERPEAEDELQGLATLRRNASSKFFTRQAWQAAVVDGKTSLGYDDWVRARNNAL